MLQNWAEACQAKTSKLPEGQLSLQLEQQTRAEAAHLLSQAATAYQEVRSQALIEKAPAP